MSGISENRMKNIKEEIGKTISSYNDVIKNLTEMKDNKINDIFWNIRADLEIIIVELKSIVQKEILLERWQKRFHDELKGTKSKEKAKVLLSKYGCARIGRPAFAEMSPTFQTIENKGGKYYVYRFDFLDSNLILYGYTSNPPKRIGIDI